jgi:P-type E1-E2 ATPase
MIVLSIRGFGELSLEHLLLDLNGTLTCGGVLLPGVAERVAQLKARLDIRLLTADTRDTATAVARTLGIAVERIAGQDEAKAKAQVAQRLGADGVAAIGNGANDAQLLATAALGIAVLGPEGLALPALSAADVVSPSITDALELLLDETRLLATLRR